ncbi:hypothetical protein EX30DRAFT_158884 [Ascodesmis nigricans]|uniref:Uncharacterized protein n=1 Tax=Ascodesmis nigricans TaxID=341454 RepID=A0A4S2MMS6_9PEZI|nr:hypothetical protein EX30DRAFT_158884 [Ascodesmis nigricans]
MPDLTGGKSGVGNRGGCGAGGGLGAGIVVEVATCGDIRCGKLGYRGTGGVLLGFRD